jgi:NTE family protein
MQSPSRRPAAAFAVLLLAMATMVSARAADAVPGPTVEAAASGSRVALILGGGGARGTAHAGALRVLVEAGIPIDMILGTSMGSLIGGLYAAGFDAATLIEVIAAVDPTSATEILFPPRGGILDGTALSLLLDALVRGIDLDETEIPFYPVVIDLLRSEPQVAPPGSLADGVRASTAIPVLFAPVEIAGEYYYDGALRRTVPSEMARALGADYVIAVGMERDVPYEPANPRANLTRVYTGIMVTLNDGGRAGADVVLDPDLLTNTYMDFDLSADFVRAGERVARQELPQILADLAALGIPLRPPVDPHLGLPINEGWAERLASARRAVALRPRPWNLAFDLGLAPAAVGERVTPSPVPAGSRLRFGVDVRDGPLGRGSAGVGYARSVAGLGDAVEFRVGYRLSYGWAVFARSELELAPRPAGQGDHRAGVRWFATPGLTLEASGRWPAATLEATARWRGDGFWLDAEAVWGLAGSWGRGHLDARVAVGPAAPGWSAWTVNGRALVGVAGAATPPSERFSVGPATGLRGVPADAWTTTSLTVLSLELERRLSDTQRVEDAALVTPSAWVFADRAWFDDAGSLQARLSVGAGAGLDVMLFGFVPVQLRVDLGYGVDHGTWRIDARLTPMRPSARRW